MIRSLYSHATAYSTDPGSDSNIKITFLRDLDHGGDKSQPSAISKLITNFISDATHSVHIAIYDFRLSQDLGADLVAQLIRLAANGLDVKIAYDHTKPNTNKATAAEKADAFLSLGGDPAPKGTHQTMQRHFAGTKVQTLPVLTIPASVADSEVGTDPVTGSHLMHNKYIVRDGNTPAAAVLTGSTNFTDDAWTHQENNIVEVNSPVLASYYETDFQELWTSGKVASTGVNDSGNLVVGKSSLAVAFAPGEGPSIDAHLASLISAATSRIKVCSMIISSQKILGALSDAITTKQVKEVDGIYDATQMDNVLRMWAKDGNPAAKTFEFVAANLVFKRSKPYTPQGLHNFMHDKILVCDDTIATGSFNLSSNATHNSENSLVIEDPKIADLYANYIDALIKDYTAK